MESKNDYNKQQFVDFKIGRHLNNEERTAFNIVKTLVENKFETYIAGGAVRDMYMGSEAHDVDIATSAKPEEVQNIFKVSHVHGKSFGVVVIKENDLEFEITTFRKDFGTEDHRRPKKVEFTSSKEDASRRDFTINGLFYDPQEENIIDFVGGIKDIDKKIVRFIGDPEERIEEDYLRMLRAVRFVNRFNFILEEKSSDAIKKNAQKVKDISIERIRDEISKMLVNKNRVESVNMMESLGLLNEIMPELLKMKGVEQAPEFHSEGDVWNHTMLALQHLPDTCSEELAWTVLLHDISKPETQGFRDHPKSKITFFEHDVLSAKKAEEILKRLKFSNEFIEKVSWSIAQHMRIIHAFGNMSDRKKMKLFSDPNINLLLEHTRADLLASIRKNGKADLSMYENALKLRDEVAKKVSKEEKEQVKKFTLITGRDILEILKITPGPKVGEIKTKIEQAYLDGKISTRVEALEMIKEK